MQVSHRLGRSYWKFLGGADLPTLWTDDERALLAGTSLKPAVDAKLKSLYREFELVRAAADAVPRCQQVWFDEVDGSVTFHDWQLIDAVYRSRALELPGVGGAMVPCLDMANHASGALASAAFELDENGDAVLVLCQDAAVLAGQEITLW